MAGHDKLQSEKLPGFNDNAMKKSRSHRVCKGSNGKGLSLTDPCRERWVLLGACLPETSTAGVTVPVMLCNTVTHVVTAKIPNWVWM